jgi:arylsulfatase A-like enzyme
MKLTWLAVPVLAVLLFILATSSDSERQPVKDPVVLVVLDGASETVFRSMLESGELPYLGRLLAPDSNGVKHGVYTPATSVWPSTTGPAYAPFLMGLFPGKSHLSGIRQYLRSERSFRAYIGRHTKEIGEDVTTEFPMIFEVLGREETFNQAGFVTRRGWRDDGAVIHPLHENYFSLPGAIGMYGLGRVADNDLQNLLSFLNYLSPDFSIKRFSDIAEFEGELFPWGRWGRRRLLVEEFFSLASLERVVRERRWSARKLGHTPKFSMISLRLPDDTSHHYGVGDEYALALLQADEIMGAIGYVFRQRGTLDDLTIIVTADHGTSTVGDAPDAHFNVIQHLSQDTGIPIHDSYLNMMGASGREIDRWREGSHRQWTGIGAVSGNGNVQLYLRQPGAPPEDWTARPSYQELRAYRVEELGDSNHEPVDLVQALLIYPQVSHVYASDRSRMQYHIISRSGEAVIRTRRNDGGKQEYSYAVELGVDPLSYASFEGTRAMVGEGLFYGGDAWAAATRESVFPDGIVQVVQLLDGPNSGDIIVDAAPGYEPWDQMQQGLHGALRRDHIVVPLLIHGPKLDVAKAERLFENGRMPRTVDVYPTILELFGMEPPERIAWEVPRFGGILGFDHGDAEVRTDIDGQPLDIWR